MAEIHVVPSWSVAGGTTQHIATLAKAFEDGIDLGSRRAHIDALIVCLQEALVSMRREAEPVLRMLDDEDPIKLNAMAKLDSLVDEVNSLISLARRLPA